jgi:arabinofuranosyltransferase
VSERARLERGDWPWLASLLLAGCLALAIFALNAHAGVPLDDAWIHFQFARNLARGDGFSFNPGQPTSGSTAPLWTLLLAAVYLVDGRFPVAGQALSAICYLALLMTTYAMGKQLTGRRWAAWLAGMVVTVNGRMVWAGLSALEICLFAALSLLAIGAHLSDRAQHRYRLRTAVLFGLAALSRPEGYLLFVLAMADCAWSTLRTAPSNQRLPASRFTSYVLRLIRQMPLLPILLFVLIILPYLIFSYQTGGHLLPNTYHAKAAVSLLPDREFRDFLSVSAVYLILDNPLLLPFLLFGLILLIQRAPLLSLWCVGLPLAYAFMRASLYQHGRYLMPLIPCNAVVAVWGLLEMRKFILNRKDAKANKNRLGVLRAFAVNKLASPGRWTVILVSVFVIAGTAWRLPEMAGQYARNVEDIDRIHVALGYWVRDNTAPDAVVALNDIGAIGYISEREVVDLAGLVTPEITPALRAPGQTQQLVDFLAQRDVAYVVIFPNWFPGLASRGDVLEEVHRVTLEDRSITGGETMVVYRANWQR